MNTIILVKTETVYNDQLNVYRYSTKKKKQGQK